MLRLLERLQDEIVALDARRCAAAGRSPKRLARPSNR
jgi:hypothetical protein